MEPPAHSLGNRSKATSPPHLICLSGLHHVPKGPASGLPLIPAAARAGFSCAPPCILGVCLVSNFPSSEWGLIY